MVEEFIDVLKESKKGNIDEKIDVLYESILTFITLVFKSFSMIDDQYKTLERKVLKLEYGLLKKQQEENEGKKTTQIPLHPPPPKIIQPTNNINLRNQIMTELKELMKKRGMVDQ